MDTHELIDSQMMAYVLPLGQPLTSRERDALQAAVTPWLTWMVRGHMNPLTEDQLGVTPIRATGAYAKWARLVNSIPEDQWHAMMARVSQRSCDSSLGSEPDDIESEAQREFSRMWTSMAPESRRIWILEMAEKYPIDGTGIAVKRWRQAMYDKMQRVPSKEA